MYIKDRIYYEEVTIVDNDSEWDGVGLNIGSADGKIILIIVVYRPPNETTEEDRTLFNALYKFFGRKNVINGDFNFPRIKWKTEHDNAGRCQEF